MAVERKPNQKKNVRADGPDNDNKLSQHEIKKKYQLQIRKVQLAKQKNKEMALNNKNKNKLQNKDNKDNNNKESEVQKEVEKNSSKNKKSKLSKKAKKVQSERTKEMSGLVENWKATKSERVLEKEKVELEFKESKLVRKRQLKEEKKERKRLKREEIGEDGFFIHKTNSKEKTEKKSDKKNNSNNDNNNNNNSSSSSSSKKSKKKKKQNSNNNNNDNANEKENSNNVKDEENANENALNYLRKWNEDKENWKFQKVRQLYLLRNIYDQKLIPKAEFKILLPYLADIKGKAREELLKQAREIFEGYMEKEKQSDDLQELTKLDKIKKYRSKNLVELLS